MTRQIIRILLLLLTVPILVAPVSAEEEIARSHSDSFRGMLKLGYAGLAIDKESSLASGYVFDKSRPMFGLSLARGFDTNHFRIDGEWLNEHDYLFEAHLDHQGLATINVLADSLHHQTLYPPVLPNAPAGSSSPTPTIRYEELNPGERMQSTASQQAVGLKLKAPLIPAHLTARYWAMQRSGTQQMTFADENCTTSQCHIQSRTRKSDRHTQEIALGIDGHVGVVDLMYEQLYRQFSETYAIPSDTFGDHSPLRPLGSYQHDEYPSARFRQSTLKAHSSLAGGVVGGVSLSLGERVGRSELADVTPARSTTELVNLAGDLTWIVDPQLTWILRYRLSTLDGDVPAALITPDISSLPPGLDVNKGHFSGSLIYRPAPRLTLKGRYQRDEIHRNQSGSASIWPLPDNEITDRYRVEVEYRPTVRGARLNGGYEYIHSADPSYAHVLEKTHRVSMKWKTGTGGVWGSHIDLRGERGRNDGADLLTGSDSYRLASDSRKGRALATFWLNPAEHLTINAMYGLDYLKERQDFYFGNYDGVDVVVDNGELRQTIQTASLGVTAQLAKTVDGLLELRHTHGLYHFGPFFEPVTIGSGAGAYTVDASGLAEINRLDLRQNGLTAEVTWRFAEQWSSTARYSYDDYDDRDALAVDGTVQTCMFNLAREW